MNATLNTTTTVTIISIWSKWDGLEGKLTGRDKNVVYNVEVEASDDQSALNEAFAVTNHDTRPVGQIVCATTPGDILIVNGTHYLVEGCGFSKLTPAVSEALQNLSSRDTSMGLAWLLKHGYLPNA